MNMLRVVAAAVVEWLCSRTGEPFVMRFPNETDAGLQERAAWLGSIAEAPSPSEESAA